MNAIYASVTFERQARVRTNVLRTTIRVLIEWKIASIDRKIPSSYFFSMVEVYFHGERIYFHHVFLQGAILTIEYSSTAQAACLIHDDVVYASVEQLADSPAPGVSSP